MVGRAVGMCIILAGASLAEYASFTKAGGESGGLLSLLGVGEQRIDAHFFNAGESELCVVDEGGDTPRYGTLEAAMKQERCTAGVNGGYFSAGTTRTPIGLLRHEGRTITPLGTKGFTVAGVVYDTGSAIRLERSARVRVPVQSMREAIQGGPFLVEQGRVISGLEKQKKAARTFIATDGAGRWCIAVSSPLTLHELATWLVEPGSMGSFRVQTALNLDGGSSSAFWDKAAGVYIPGLKAVRNYVGVRPRRLKGGAAGNKQPAK